MTAKQAIQAPIGLRLAFAAINDEGATSTAAAWRADNAYPAAAQVIARMHQDDPNDDVINQEIAAVARRMYSSDQDPVSEPSMVGSAAFCLGFAACWLVLTAINGNGGAR